MLSGCLYVFVRVTPRIVSESDHRLAEHGQLLRLGRGGAAGARLEYQAVLLVERERVTTALAGVKPALPVAPQPRVSPVIRG